MFGPTPGTHLIFATLLAVALVFDFLNGFHDAANVVATMIASRALSPRAALLLAAGANLVGPLLFGLAVANTVGKEVVDPSGVTITVVLAALLAASSWNLVTWWWGIPSSSSHALAGGLVGGAAAFGGWSIIRVAGLTKVALALFVSPLLGFVVAWLVLRFILGAARGATPRINKHFNRLQLLSATALALSHGTNDAQKTMGIITMGLVTLGYQATFHVPLWVVLASATAIGLGTAAGGWRIIRTLGGKFYRIRPIHSLTSQTAAAAVILSASLLGGPVSTTHVVSSAIVGAGASERMSQVRWMNLADIGVAWLITVPITALLGAAAYLMLRPLIGA
ncbi:MAG: inorganic phosphate transporter [Caldilineae bacterium]|nr:inorganic phosphate transporter [Chloroflexota bacterium]MCB9175768.1 inorganic phosphate transporter [Caldilineae bacterium]